MSRDEIVAPDYGVLVTPRWVSKDTRLSMEARGLWMMMHAFGGTTWRFRKLHLQKLACAGDTKFERMIRELIAVDYLSIELVRGAAGRVEGSRYVLNPYPPLPDHDPSDYDDDPEMAAIMALDIEAQRAAREAAAKAAGPAARSITRAAAKAEKAARVSASAGEKTAKTPANHRDPENQGPGVETAENAPNRDGGFPGPGKRGSLVNIKDNIKPLTPLEDSEGSSEPETRSDPSQKKEAGEEAALGGDVDHEQLARQWAGPVSRGAVYAKSWVRPETARSMLEQGLVTPEQLRSIGIPH